MLAPAALQNLLTWRFDGDFPNAERHRVSYDFTINPEVVEGFLEGAKGSAEFDGTRVVRISSAPRASMVKGECPTARQQPPVEPIASTDFLKLTGSADNLIEITVYGSGRVVRIDAKPGKTPRQRHYRIPVSQATRLIELFRNAEVWNLCGSYARQNIYDAGGVELEVFIGGATKRISDYGGTSPKWFSDLEGDVFRAVPAR